MILVKSVLSATAIALLMGTAALVTSTGPASARVVCNNSGDCWHTDQRVKYPPTVTMQIHPDDWYFHQTWTGSDRHYRDYHSGRGYYNGGVWIGF